MAPISVQSIRATLDAARVGFNGQPHFVGLLSPAPFTLTPDAWQRLCLSGERYQRLVAALHASSLRAMRGDEVWSWLLPFVEADAPPPLVALNRSLTLARPPRPPAFFRLDQPLPGVAVEAQVPGSGWGSRQALAAAYGLPLPDAVRVFIDTARALTGKQHPRVVHVRRTPEFGNDDGYFAAAVRAAGIDFRISVQNVPPPDEVDLVLRHYLADFAEFPGAAAALAAYREGALEIEPPPSLLTDHKLGMAALFDPRWSVTDPRSRELFPETRIARSGDIAAVMDRRTSQRNVILKYAGLDPLLRAKGRAVYNLGQCSRTFALRLAQEIEQSGRPWILQEAVREKFTLTAEREAGGPLVEQQLSARFAPLFAAVGSVVSLMACTANFRNFWKVSSHHDSVLVPVIPQGGTIDVPAAPSCPAVPARHPRPWFQVWGSLLPAPARTSVG